MLKRILLGTLAVLAGVLVLIVAYAGLARQRGAARVEWYAHRRGPRRPR